MSEGDLMEKVVGLAKRRGFIYQGSEIYGGLSGTWDYGPTGIALKRNITNLWWKKFVDNREDIYGLDAAILMHPRVWETSGHVSGFSDPMVECEKCQGRFRADHLEDASVCPSCEGKLGEIKQFNMMFETAVGTVEDSSSKTYLRPETAGGIFTNFKNVLDTLHPRLPFGIAQIGKAFRNEIAPRDFVFRAREFEQMEIEWFVRESDWEKSFEEWKEIMWQWMDLVGIDRDSVHELEVEGDDLAHYSKRTIDFEYDYPFGRKELYGLAYRTDHDLKAHMEASGVDLQYFDQEAGEKFIPHVVEPTFGVDRTVLAVLLSAYDEEEVEGETRVVLRFKPSVAPVQVAILPLMRKEQLTEKARGLFKEMSQNFKAHYDETGSIGKRYRRQDEIGTPLCVTIDFDSLEDNAVTVRDRDSMEQDRVALTDLSAYLTERLT